MNKPTEFENALEKIFSKEQINLLKTNQWVLPELYQIYQVGKLFYNDYAKRLKQRRILEQKEFWIGLTYNEKKRL